MTSLDIGNYLSSSWTIENSDLKEIEVRKYKRYYRLYYRYDPWNNKWLYIDSRDCQITMDFEVSRNNLATANTCRLTLYNLSEQTRNLMFRDALDIGKPFDSKETGFIETDEGLEERLKNEDVDKTRNYIELYAGYESTHTDYEIFSGLVLSAYSYKNGVDYITEISGYSCNLRDPLTYLSYTVKAGTKVGSVIKNLASQIAGVREVKISEEIANNVFTEDTVIMGTAEDILINQFNYKPFVDNQYLEIFTDRTAIKDDPPVIPSYYFLSSPRRTQNGVKISIIFEPTLQVGQLVQLGSSIEETYNNTPFVISGFRHSGVISSVRDGMTTTEAELIIGKAGYFRPPKVDPIFADAPKNVTVKELFNPNSSL